MKYQLIKPINTTYNAIQQIVTNRGIDINEVNHYLNTTDNDINDFKLLGEDLLKQAALILTKGIANRTSTLLIVDCDCDGFTSAALLTNYLYTIAPSYVENNLKWYVHEGKQHGLSDCMQYINSNDYKLILIPDAGSNDYECHKELKDKNIDIIILDHHLADQRSEDAIVINNQLCDYPNKEFSGVGVTWQFCRYLDNILEKDFSNNFLDLVALGLR